MLESDALVAERCRELEAHIAENMREGNARRILLLFNRRTRVMAGWYQRPGGFLRLRFPLWTAGRGRPRRLTDEVSPAVLQGAVDSANSCLGDQLQRVRVRVRYSRRGAVHLSLEEWARRSVLAPGG